MHGVNLAPMRTRVVGDGPANPMDCMNVTKYLMHNRDPNENHKANSATI